MTARAVQFRCHNCQAKIRAPYQMAGQARRCPGCGHGFVVPSGHEDSGPVLVLLERSENFSLRPRYPFRASA